MHRIIDRVAMKDYNAVTHRTKPKKSHLIKSHIHLLSHHYVIIYHKIKVFLTLFCFQKDISDWKARNSNNRCSIEATIVAVNK